MTATGYPVPAISSASVVMTPAGPADMDHFTTRSSTGSVDCSAAILSFPVVSTPEEGQSSRAAPVDIGQQSSSSSFGGEPAERPLPPVSLTPRQTGASPHVGDSDADGGRPGVPDLSREGPFHVHQDRPHSGASPRFLDGGQGCQFRMTSYDEENSGTDFLPAYGVQLHDLCLRWAHQNRHVSSLAAQNTGCITWEEKRHSRPLFSCSTMLG